MAEGEPKEKESALDKVFQIMNDVGGDGNQFMECERKGGNLSFNTEFSSEKTAKEAYDQLVQLGQKPNTRGRKVSLTAVFPIEDINRLADIYVTIPKEEE